MKRLLKISKTTCIPCKIVSNYLNDMELEFTDINIDEDSTIIDKYNINGVPVVLLLDDNGEEVERVVGFNPHALDELVSKIN